MNTATILVVGGLLTPLAAVIGALATLWVKRNDAVKVLADAQTIAQTTAVTTTTAALTTVQKQCDRCLDELHGLRDITGQLVDAVEALMQRDTDESRAQTRAAIRLARRVM